MAKDMDKELAKLQKALLEEETAPTPDLTPVDQDTDVGSVTEFHNHAGTFRAYNTDRIDVDLEEFSRRVEEGDAPRRGGLLWLVILLAAAVIGLSFLLAAKVGGYL